MAITAAKLMVEVDANTAPAERGLGQVSRGLGKFGTAVSVAFGAFAGQALFAATGALANLGGEALTSYADFERLGASLTRLTARELVNSGAATDMAEALKMAGPMAAETLQWVQKLAVESPFTQKGVADALRMAQAYGFTSEEAKRLTQATIDFAAGSGASEESMGQITLALGQIKSKGKLAGQEVLQLVNAGINVDEILAKAFGKSTAEIVAMREKGLIPADEAIEAITASMEDDFGGAAKEQASSMAGLTSSLEDIKTIGLRELFTGIFEALQPLVADFTTWVSGDGMVKLREMGTTLGGLAQKVITFAKEFAASGTLQKGFAWLKANLEPIKGALIGIGAALAIGATIAAVAGAIALLTNPLFLLIAAGALLGAAWTNNWGGIRTTLTEFWNTTGKPIFNQLVEWLQTNIPVGIQKVTDFWNNTLMPALKDVWSYLSNNLVPMWKDLTTWLQENIPTAIKALTDFWNTTLLPTLQDLNAFWNDKLLPTLKAVWDFLSVTMMPVWQALGDLLQTVVKKAIEELMRMWDDWMIKSDAISKFVNETLVPMFVNWVGGLDGVKSMLEKVVGWIVDLNDWLSKLELPDWMVANSPTPWEMGLRGVAKTMRQLARQEMPAFEARLTSMPAPAMAMAMAGSGGTGNSSNFSMGDVHVYAAPGQDAQAVAGAVIAAMQVQARRRAQAGLGYAGV